jgi:acetyl esterase/lipase
MKGHPTKRVCGVSLSLYTHAGVGHHPTGFVIGLAGSTVYHRCLIDLAVAVSVDYHLAPEHSVPATYVDSLTSLKWVLSSAADPWLAAHGDPAHMFFAGDNAGGKIHVGGAHRIHAGGRQRGRKTRQRHPTTTVRAAIKRPAAALLTTTNLRWPTPAAARRRGRGGGGSMVWGGGLCPSRP